MALDEQTTLTIREDGTIEAFGRKFFNPKQVADYIAQRHETIVGLTAAINGPRRIQPKAFETQAEFLARGGQIVKIQTIKRISRSAANALTLEDLGL